MITAFACKNDEAEVKPSHPLDGTTWTSYQFGFPDGRKLYKVLEFKPVAQLAINYKIEKQEVYYAVGQFYYGSQNSNFWVLNADGKRTDGIVSGSIITFANELFTKEQ